MDNKMTFAPNSIATAFSSKRNYRNMLSPPTHNDTAIVTIEHLFDSADLSTVWLVSNLKALDRDCMAPSIMLICLQLSCAVLKAM